jgi:hypothetical protein
MEDKLLNQFRHRFPQYLVTCMARTSVSYEANFIVQKQLETTMRTYREPLRTALTRRNRRINLVKQIDSVAQIRINETKQTKVANNSPP